MTSEKDERLDSANIKKNVRRLKIVHSSVVVFADEPVRRCLY